MSTDSVARRATTDSDLERRAAEILRQSNTRLKAQRADRERARVDAALKAWRAESKTIGPHGWLWTKGATMPLKWQDKRVGPQVADWTLIQRFKEAPPSRPADRGRVDQRVDAGRAAGLVASPSKITRKALRVLDAKLLRHLLCIDSEQASRDRQIVAGDDRAITRADVVKLERQAARWTKVARLLDAALERVIRTPKTSGRTYRVVRFSLTDDEISDLRALRKSAARLAVDAGQEVQKAEERDWVARRPRLGAVPKIRERVRVLLAVLQAGGDEWTVGDLADLIVASEKDWANPPTPLAHAYRYPSTLPRAEKLANERRRKLIAWLEKTLRRGDS